MGPSRRAGGAAMAALRRLASRTTLQQTQSNLQPSEVFLLQGGIGTEKNVSLSLSPVLGRSIMCNASCGSGWEGARSAMSGIVSPPVRFMTSGDAGDSGETEDVGLEEAVPEDPPQEVEEDLAQEEDLHLHLPASAPASAPLAPGCAGAPMCKAFAFEPENSPGVDAVLHQAR